MEARGPVRRIRPRLLLAGATAALVAAAVALYSMRSGRTPGPTSPARPPAVAAATTPAAQYVGGQACARCHRRERDLWQGAHHALAMQRADATTVLGDFGNARLTYAGTTSTFFKRGGKFFVKTDGPDGTVADFEIRYTLGVAPLQQYLIEFPDGRIQALGIAWDTRPKARGGQRWFHLYPGRGVKHTDPRHWTGLDQNWNFMCAECHSTNVRKRYDASANRFATTWSEIDVSCEACHGPGSEHVAWADKAPGWQRVDGTRKGLVMTLDERKGVTWAPSAETGQPQRSQPRQSSREIETCARCHSRGSPMSDAYVHGQPLLDTHRLALLDDGLYWSDGQIRGEVYEYGSFLQSRMYARGVTCSDCHDPHRGALRAPGNGVCAECHQPTKYDGPEHHFHPEGSAGAQCAACHMPATTAMVVDRRHDHSLRIPRPDESVRLGTPNACNRCHAERSARWAAERLQRWYGRAPTGYQRFAEALQAGSRGAPGAPGLLLSVVNDEGQSAIARASALSRLGRYPSPVTVAVARTALEDRNPIVRAAAVGALSTADPSIRAPLLFRMLGDPVRAVRVETARVLAAVRDSQLDAAQRVALAGGLEEYEASQRFNADRPEARVNLGTLYGERGQVDRAEAEFRAALALDPTFAPAAVNLADLFRRQGREADAEAALRAVLARDPASAGAHHALGLSLVRQTRMPEALRELGEAVRLAPDQARLGYVYAVALHDTGQRRRAITALGAVLERHPYDREALYALAVYHREAGALPKARGYAKRLVELEPDEPRARALLTELERPR